jgi:hypothetical protein
MLFHTFSTSLFCQNILHNLQTFRLLDEDVELSIQLLFLVCPFLFLLQQEVANKLSQASA